MEEIFLVVGLGNPGERYARTRHNAGFLVVDELARRWGLVWRPESRFRASLAAGRSAGGRCLLCKPQTFMNLSGEAVGALATYYRCPASRVLLAVDDADLPLGTIRLRASGSSGGHHGLASVERHLGTRVFARLRLGIGRRAQDGRRLTGHVLGHFAADERPLLENVLARGADAVICWMVADVETAMNRYNGVVETPNSQDA